MNAKLISYLDSIWYSSLQAKMAVVSFLVGSIIACVCLFRIEPLGDISTTAISIVSEFLVLAGSLLGIKASFDHKTQQFEAELAKKADKNQE